MEQGLETERPVQSQCRKPGWKEDDPDQGAEVERSQGNAFKKLI